LARSAGRIRDAPASVDDTIELPLIPQRCAPPLPGANRSFDQESQTMKHPGTPPRRRAPADRAEKMKRLSALMATVFAVSAHAAATEAWVATGTRAHDPRAAVHVAPLRAGEQVDIVVSLRPRDKAGLDALSARLMAGGQGVHPLSPAEFMARHAPSAAQAQAVVDYLRAQGFSHIEVAPNRLLVSATGTAGAIRSAFKADLHEYDVDGRRAYANVTDALVPAHLASTVLGVVGLQNVHMMHTQARRLAHGDAASTQASGGVRMTDFPAIYGASSLPRAGLGNVGIITSGSLTQTIADLKSFAASAGYSMPPVVTTVVGSAGAGTSGTDEWNLDTQAVLAAAGGQLEQMILYNVANLSDASLTKAYNQAVTDGSARAINVSLGACETDEASIEPTQDAIFQTAVAQGQMFSVSSGDAGAYECGATAGRAQSYPAASPYVMAVGGTTLSTTAGNTWAGETAWSCASASSCQSGGGGGGPSLTETAPSWQLASGVLGTSTRRGVPDISFDAAPGTGALVLVDGQPVQIGGTSLGAPLWTGFWARIQSTHNWLSNNPARVMYSQGAAHPQWFHDVTSGNQGYQARPGWDYATGWGSVQVANFSAAFGQPVEPPHPSPTPPPPPPFPNPIVNSGFEGSAAPWTVSAGTWCTNSTCPGETALWDTGFLWLDGYGTAHTDTASQTFTVGGKTGAVLKFALHVDTDETTRTVVRDKLTVAITSGGTTTTIGTFSNLDAGKGYFQNAIDLHAWMGKSVTLKFTGAENGSAQTSFVIDGVYVDAW
jgi:pseudomonalisin